MATKLETSLVMRAAMPRLFLSDYRINEVEKADARTLAELFRHHWECGAADELDGLYRQLDRQEDAARRRTGWGWEYAECLRNALEDAFVHRLVPSLYALRRLSETYDLYDDVLAMVMRIDAKIKAALLLLDAIRKAIPAHRRRYLPLKWLMLSIVQEIDDVLTEGIAALCERVGIEVPEKLTPLSASLRKELKWKRH